MEDSKLLKEDLNTVGKPSTEEERAEVKKEMIKKAVGNEDLELDNQSDEQLDDLLVKFLKTSDGDIKNTVDEIFESMKAVDASPIDIVEALRVNLNLKMREAKELYMDKLSDLLLEKKTNRIARVYETLGLEGKEEILNNNEPENVEPVSMNTEVPPVKEDPIKSLEDQKGEKID